MKAFPDPHIKEESRQGMDLRDWFAGLAMQVIIADSKGFSSFEVAKFSYQMADLMMKARNEINKQV